MDAIGEPSEATRAEFHLTEAIKRVIIDPPSVQGNVVTELLPFRVMNIDITLATLHVVRLDKEIEVTDKQRGNAGPLVVERLRQAGASVLLPFLMEVSPRRRVGVSHMLMGGALDASARRTEQH